jgi:hypothetical protein
MRLSKKAQEVLSLLAQFCKKCPGIHKAGGLNINLLKELKTVQESDIQSLIENNFVEVFPQLEEIANKMEDSELKNIILSKKNSLVHLRITKLGLQYLDDLPNQK